MPTKFDLGDESLSVAAKATPDPTIQAAADPNEKERIKASLPGMLLSMGFTIWFYSNFWGWIFALGWVLSIFIHEIGHAVAARRFGSRFIRIRFIPILGGEFVYENINLTVTERAFISIMGPVFGAATGLICTLIFFFTLDPNWRSIALINFILNALNAVLPIPPLDGGNIAKVFSKKSNATREQRIKWGFAWGGLVLLLLLGPVLLVLIQILR